MARTFFAALVLVLPFLISTPASAQEKVTPAMIQDELIALKKKVEACGQIADDRAKRLRCYDIIAKEYNYLSDALLGETEQSLGKFGFWNVIEKKSEAEEITTYLRLDSSNPVRSAYGAEKWPTLVLRCKNKKTEVYLDWGSPLEEPQSKKDQKYLTYKFDSQEEYATDWDLSVDRFSAFAPDSKEFIREMKGRQKLILRTTPHGQGAVTLLYKMQGFDNALAVLVDRCYK